MWTMVSTPAENGGAPFMPVSRVWSFTHKPVNSDFSYVIFDWDNFLATLLAACGASNSSGDGYDGYDGYGSNGSNDRYGSNRSNGGYDGYGGYSGYDSYSGFAFAASNLFQVCGKMNV